MASLEPLATFDVRSAVALQAPNFSLLDGAEETVSREDCTAAQARELSITPSEPESQADADFLGRLHHFKNMFRMSATEDPVSVLIHKVGPLLIFDDGPRVRDRVDRTDGNQIPGFDHEQSQLMLAELDPSLEMALGTSSRPAGYSRPGLLAPELNSLNSRLCVKNTFLDVDEDDENESLGRAQSAPGRVDCDTPRSMFSDDPRRLLPGDPTLVRQQLQQHADRAANAWSLIPYEPGDHFSCELAARHWELLQCTSGKGNPGNAVVEAVRSVFDIPPQPSRFGRAVEWRCGPYKILLGCDLVVMHSADRCDHSDFASFKMLPPNGTGLPSRNERLDMYLENMMCDISKAVWGSPGAGDSGPSWRVFNTADLPVSPGEGEDFDAKQLHQHSQQLLHFLRQKCNREGGTYWLFREANSSAVELYDLSSSMEADNWDSSAFRTTPSLAPPIASLCAHLAQSMPQNEEKRQLLQKAVHLLEPLKEEHFGLYSMSALELACSYMRTPLAAISDKADSTRQQRPDAPASARLSVALRYLESVLRLLGGLDESSLRAGLLLQAQVAYAECIIKLIREAAVPTYSAWLADIQSAQEAQDSRKGRAQRQLDEMKQLSAAFLLWRLFWLCRAQRAMSFLPNEKREVECWTIDRDLCEVMGDTLYGLSRYPADDVDALLAGQMATAEGICTLVEEGLRTWALQGQTETGPGKSKLSSDAQPHGQLVGAIFLSKMNPLQRQLGDRALKEDPLVRDDLRRALWSEGHAMQQCLSLYHRAVARLRRDCKDPTTLRAMAMRWRWTAMFETDTDCTGLGKGHTCPV